MMMSETVGLFCRTQYLLMKAWLQHFLLLFSNIHICYCWAKDSGIHNLGIAVIIARDGTRGRGVHRNVIRSSGRPARHGCRGADKRELPRHLLHTCPIASTDAERVPLLHFRHVRRHGGASKIMSL